MTVVVSGEKLATIRALVDSQIKAPPREILDMILAR